jgi:serine/threonine-protein kinase HipA
MTSDANYTQAFVWVWLPDQTEPVVAGLLSASGKQLVFNYGRSYLARNDAIPLYEPELPLRSGILPLTAGLNMPNCIRDGAPDAWGRRIIINSAPGRTRSGPSPWKLDRGCTPEGDDLVGQQEICCEILIAERPLRRC